MDKISGILPRSARVKSVDLSEAPPARPGAPTVGRSEGRNSIKDRFTISDQAKDLALKDTLAYKNPKESLRAQMVEDVSKKFFDTRLKSVGDEDQPSSERITKATLTKVFEDPIQTSTSDSVEADEVQVQE